MNLTCVGIFRAFKIVKVKPHSSVKLVSCMQTADEWRTRWGFLGICFEIEVGYSHGAHSQPKNRPKQPPASHCFVLVSGSKCDCPLNSALILLYNTLPAVTTSDYQCYTACHVCSTMWVGCLLLTLCDSCDIGSRIDKMILYKKSEPPLILRWHFDHVKSSLRRLQEATGRFLCLWLVFVRSSLVTM